MGGSYGGRVLGSSTLGMKGIAGEPRSPQSFQGASVFNKNSYLSSCTRLLASRSSAGEGRSPASDPPHRWSSGLPAVTLSLCKSRLLIAVVEQADSLLCLLRKEFLIFFLNRELKERDEGEMEGPKRSKPMILQGSSPSRSETDRFLS